MVAGEGDIYWYDFGLPRGSAPAYRRPVVVVQSDMFNQSALATIVICALTSNLRMARFPGNVSLMVGEGGLDRTSVVVVTQVYTLDREMLDTYIGTLGMDRLAVIRIGIRAVLGDETALDILANGP
ncbi:MAG TPA: type II toxin-antitoxin system PemK/MazF family toxin [Chloroflexota bacterium]|nr:type II toxin-antitoxin system PemK/MazF family toxin [Chloroflexota bacterium]